MDVKYGASISCSSLDILGLSSFGASPNLHSENSLMECVTGDFVLVSFGWSVIGCKSFDFFSEGVNPKIFLRFEFYSEAEISIP